VQVCTTTARAKGQCAHTIRTGAGSVAFASLSDVAAGRVGEHVAIASPRDGEGEGLNNAAEIDGCLLAVAAAAVRPVDDRVGYLMDLAGIVLDLEVDMVIWKIILALRILPSHGPGPSGPLGRCTGLVINT